MNQTWLSSLQDFGQSQNLPMWLTVVALVFFALILIVTLFRAEHSVANGALTVITMLAIGIAVASMMRASGSIGQNALDVKTAVPGAATLPALSCLDGMSGEAVEAACERALFASADSAAAAVSYAAAQVSRLASFGNVAAANAVMSPELNVLRRTIERDRFGLIAQVLVTREGCTLTGCPFFNSLTNSAQITSNINDRFYEGVVANYAPRWGTPSPTAAVPPTGAPSLAGLAPVAPTGRPVSGDFPSAASIPPVNIMTPESAPQGASAPPPRAAENAAPATPRATPVPPPAAAKKQAAPKTRAQAPTSLVPQQADDDN